MANAAKLRMIRKLRLTWEAASNISTCPTAQQTLFNRANYVKGRTVCNTVISVKQKNMYNTTNCQTEQLCLTQQTVSNDRTVSNIASHLSPAQITVFDTALCLTEHTVFNTATCAYNSKGFPTQLTFYNTAK